uniref:Uncharacterized protein n=1 Tax=Meloidogyne incognita TaxID=6306 RepID=A0A914NBJ5_MELIC
MLADMINRNKVPWHMEEELGDVEKLKEAVCSHPASLFKDEELTELRLFCSLERQTAS